jgi:hypothetical protein
MWARTGICDDHTAFNAALDQHCREAARIVEQFAGGWIARPGESSVRYQW